jgi:hypothetical protein
VSRPPLVGDEEVAQDDSELYQLPVRCLSLQQRWGLTLCGPLSQPHLHWSRPDPTSNGCQLRALGYRRVHIPVRDTEKALLILDQV